MKQTGSPTGGWDVVANNDGAAALIGAILELDVEETYTRSELAASADVPLKQLYLSDALEELVSIGLLEPVDDTSEATYAIDDEAPVYESAATFDATVADELTE